MNLMKWGLLILLFPILSVAKAKVEDGYFAVKTKHLDSFRATYQSVSVKELKRDGGYSLVRLNNQQIMQITTHIHQLEHNCGGLIDLSVDVKAKRLSIFSVFDSFMDVPAIPEKAFTLDDKAKVLEVVNHLSKTEYEKTLRAFTSFPNRYANGANGYEAAYWLRDTALKYANDLGRKDVKATAFETPRYQQPSILITVPGTKPSLPGVLIGGHMDSYSGNKPAVDDDASGTIAAMETLRAILASGKRFERNIFIAFYAAEEWGLHGSKVMANEFKRQNIQLEGIMQLDMIAYSQKTNKHFTFVRDFTNDGLTNFTKTLAMEYLNTPEDKIGDTVCGYGCSDHASWHRNGYRAVTPFEAHFDGMNDDLHTSRDTMALADIDHAFRFVQLGTAFVSELANPQ
ncbi:MAG: M20/M25/M40 family metallo-hydrolase [Bdellovibrionota bacterium]